MVAEAKAQQCIIYCVTLGMAAPQCLKDIANQTGGLVFEKVTTIQEAEEIYKKFFLFLNKEILVKLYGKVEEYAKKMLSH